MLYFSHSQDQRQDREQMKLERQIDRWSIRERRYFLILSLNEYKE